MEFIHPFFNMFKNGKPSIFMGHGFHGFHGEPTISGDPSPPKATTQAGMIAVF